MAEAGCYSFFTGSYSFPNASVDKNAQIWFDRGMVWCFGFHHEEAIFCFEQCLKLDPSSYMAHFGISFAHGPDYNVHVGNYYPAMCHTPSYPSMEESVKHAKLALQKMEARGNVDTSHRALILAIQSRYVWPNPEPLGADGMFSPVFLQKLTEAFASEMRKVYKELGHNNADVCCFFAEALMTVSPWKLYDGKSYEPLAIVPEIKEALKRGLELSPYHPGLNHLMIHFSEMSPTPQDAIPACTRLLSAGSTPDMPTDVPHLLHMPSHTYLLLGQYKDAVDSNVRAIAVDRKIYDPSLSRVIGTPFYTGYVYHDYHTLVYGAMLAGNESIACEYASELEQKMRTEGVVEKMPEDLEGYTIQYVHVLVRFGRWEEILQKFDPAIVLSNMDPEIWCATLSMARYARAVAYAALGRISEAEEEELQFARVAKIYGVFSYKVQTKNPCMESHELSTGVVASNDFEVPPLISGVSLVRRLHNCDMADIGAVAAKVIKGEILYRRGMMEDSKARLIDEAFKSLREGVILEDSLNYDEPWGWMMPVRHPLGGLLLEQGRIEEAGEVFRADLSGLGDGRHPSHGPRHNRHPENIWSLIGLEDCFSKGLARREELVSIGGLGESEEDMAKRLGNARAGADVVISASCACVRTKAVPRKKDGCCGCS